VRCYVLLERRLLLRGFRSWESEADMAFGYATVSLLTRLSLLQEVLPLLMGLMLVEEKNKVWIYDMTLLLRPKGQSPSMFSRRPSYGQCCFSLALVACMYLVTSLPKAPKNLRRCSSIANSLGTAFPYNFAAAPCRNVLNHPSLRLTDQ